MTIDYQPLPEPIPMEQPADDQQQRMLEHAIRAANEVDSFGTSLNSLLIVHKSRYRIVEA